jgi:long-chain acyl-CoA synthetase
VRGLAALGLRRGDRLAVLGDNRPVLYRAQLAAMALGGVAVPCWPDADPEWLAHVLAEARVRVAVAEDEDQVAKLISIKDQLPDLVAVILTDPLGIHRDKASFIHLLQDVLKAGSADGCDVDAAIADGRPEDVALLIYVTPASGTVRGAILTHANLIAAATALSRIEDVRQTDEYFAYLPMAWIGEALYGVTLALLVGFTCSCPEDPETARRDLRELGPTILLLPPRICESLLSEIAIKASHATPLKRRLCATFLPDAFEDRAPTGGGVLAEWLVHAPLRDQLGLGRLRWAHSGGIPFDPHLHQFFRTIGVNLKHGFGPAECAGLMSLAAEVGAPGSVAPGTQTRIGADGTLELRGASLFIGYHMLETEPGRTDGWWRSDQFAESGSSGVPQIQGRLADRGHLADGTELVPERIEQALRGSRFIADAIALGDGCPSVVAFIAADTVTIGDWAHARGLAYSSVADLLALPEVEALIREEVGLVNRKQPEALRIRRWHLLDSAPGAANVEASLSSVVRRRRVLAMKNSVNALVAEPAHTPSTSRDTGQVIRERMS